MDFQEIFDKIGFDPKVALFNVINFLVFFMVLNKFVFGKVGNIIQEREKKIAKGLKDAEEAGKAKEVAEQKALEIIQDASKKGNAIINESRDAAEKLAVDTKVRAAEDIEQQKQAAKKQLENDRKEMVKDLKEKTAELAIMATEKIIKEKLDGQKDKNIINSYLDQIDEEEK